MIIDNAIYTCPYAINQAQELKYQNVNSILKVVFLPTSTSSIDNSQIGLYEELDKIYEDCKEDGWEIEDGEISKGIMTKSYEQAKSFLSYINNSIPLPDIDPYFNGLIGFTWTSEKATILVMFRGNNKFTYSIATKNKNIFASVEQTDNNQKDFIKSISEVL